LYRPAGRRATAGAVNFVAARRGGRELVRGSSRHTRAVGCDEPLVSLARPRERHTSSSRRSFQPPRIDLQMAETPREKDGCEMNRLATSAAAVVLLSLVLALAGCSRGTTASPSPLTASSSQAAPTSPSGAGQPSPDRLVVHRTDAFPQNHIRYAFPVTVTVTDAAHVRLVARAVADLPVMPTGTFLCPADFGIVYHLSFFASGQKESTVNIQATGCQEVKGLGATRWIARSPGFWHILGVAMRLASPTYATFRGTGP
jgi:hypothetical protein